MDITFHSDDLRRLFEDATFDDGRSRSLAKAYRKRITAFQAANDERDIAFVRGNRFEKLSGRDEEYSVRLNDQWRLTFTFEDRNGKKTVVFLRIEDYH